MGANVDKAVEAAVAGRGLGGERVAPADLDKLIVAEAYHVFPGTTVTVCALTLANGYVVTGTSACADPANFDRELGQDIARAEARDKIWELEGYLLRQRLHDHIVSTKAIDGASRKLTAAGWSRIQPGLEGRVVSTGGSGPHRYAWIDTRFEKES
jgi:hypothetical protein